MEAKIQLKIAELKVALQNVKGFTLVSFNDKSKLCGCTDNSTIYVRLEKKQPSGYLSIKEKIIIISDINREIEITKTLLSRE